MAFKFQLGAARMSGSLTQEEGITVDSGGLTVTAGGATVTAGGLTVSAGTTAVAALTATTLSGSGAISTLSTLAADGAATLNAGLTVAGGTTTMEGASCTSLSVGDGNITNVGDIALDSISADGAALSIDSNWDAAGVTCSDLGAVTTCDINGGTIGGVTLDGNLAGTPNFTGIATHAATEVYNAGLSVKNGATSAGFIKFFEDSDNGTNAITLAAPSATGDVNLTLPAVAGTLVTDAGMGGNIDIGAYSLTAETLVSDVATGTAPFTVSSTTVVANLNASTLGGATMAEPGAIGGTTAAAIDCTVLKAETSVRPDALGSATLGADGIGWGDVYIADDKKIKFGNGNDATIEYDEDGTDELRFAGADVTFEQAVTFDGNTTFGNATSDTCTVTARLASSLVPSADSTRDLGTSALRWSTLYVDSIVGPNIAWDVVTCDGGDTISASAEVAFVRVGNNVTVTLPTVSAGKNVRIKLSSSVGDVVIAAGTGDMVENGSSIRLESTGSAVTLIGVDDQNWFVI